VVRDYEVLGIFAAPPLNIWAEVPIIYSPEMPEYMKTEEPQQGFARTNIAAIASEFEGQKLFGFEGERIIRYKGGSIEGVRHEDIYRSDIE
jgi:hypothetical protein